jgi:hypothetical protein
MKTQHRRADGTCLIHRRDQWCPRCLHPDPRASEGKGQAMTTEDATAPPREPTRAMLDAANKMFSGIHYPQTLRDIWLTMYDARPTPAPAPVEVAMSEQVDVEGLRDWVRSFPETAPLAVAINAAAAEITALRNLLHVTEEGRLREQQRAAAEITALRERVAADAERIAWLDGEVLRHLARTPAPAPVEVDGEAMSERKGKV